MKQRLLVTWRKLDHSIVSAAINHCCHRLSACVSYARSERFSTFCDGFMVQSVKLMLSKFQRLWFLLFGCLVRRQNVTCAKCFTRYGIIQVRWKT